MRHVTFFGALIASTFGFAVSAQSWTWNSAPSTAILSDVQRSGVMASIRSQVEADASSLKYEETESLTNVYQPSPARTKANLAHFLAQARAQSPAAAAELEGLFSQMDVIGAVSGEMRSGGLDPANTADAYALWWVVAWSAAYGRPAPEDDATFQAVSRQARAAFASTDDFAGLPDADKQQFAEALMVQALLLDSANQQAGSDPTIRRQLAQQAKRGASEMGLDLTTMTLTPQGFRPIKGAALDPAATGEADPQLAATTAVQEAGAGEENTLTTYAAIAAAAGAGLAGAYWLGKAGRG